MQTAVEPQQHDLIVPPGTQTDERAARRALRGQIERLEAELTGLFTSDWPRRATPATTAGGRGARLLSLGQLERLRDDLAARADAARRELSQRTLIEEEHRVRIEAMLLEPEAHRWTRVSNADIGEPGCKHWHVRPRWGLLGALMSWWRVRISSGCPLARGRGRSTPARPPSPASRTRVAAAAPPHRGRPRWGSSPSWVAAS